MPESPLPPIDAPTADCLAAVMRALGNPQRVRIIAELCVHGELAVGEIARRVGLPQAATSQQLGILRGAGLVRYRLHQGYRLYDVGSPGLPDLLACLSRCAALHHPLLRPTPVLPEESP